MRHRIPRREFLGAMTALAAASAFPTSPLLAREVLYPPMDLSNFDTPLAPAPSSSAGLAGMRYDSEAQAPSRTTRRPAAR